MQYRELGRTGLNVSRIAYGGIVSSSFFDNVTIPGDGQAASDRCVAWAVDHGVNYFDVAPSYGNAQLMMGNSLRPWRGQVHLACKTNVRTREGAEAELRESMNLLHTDHFEVYQLHGLETMDELETAFGPGGVMEMASRLKERGIAANVGFSAHSEAVALKALELYDFDSVMFPFNWHMNLAHDMGTQLSRTVTEKGLGLICLKSMIERAWKPDERMASRYPKSWCKPFDVDADADLLCAAMKYALSLGVDILVPPGNFDHFRFAVEHIDDLLAHPLSGDDLALLKAHLPEVEAYPFFDVE